MRYWEDLYISQREVWGREPTPIARELVSLLKKPSDVLDIGCGYGRDSVFLAKKGHRVRGIDPARSAIFIAHSLAMEAEVSPTFSTKDFLEVEIAPSSFDCILMANVLEFLDQRGRKAAAKKVFKLLRPQGLVGLQAFSTDDPRFGNGPKLAENTYETAPGRQTHFFTKREITFHFTDFETLKLEIVDVPEEHGGKHVHRYWHYLGKRKL